MSDKPWKQFERIVASLIGGRRAWANSGEAIDCFSERFVAQCKLVARMSLAEISALAEAITTEGRKSAREGILCLKLRAGKGVPSPTLVVMTSETFTRLCGYNQAQTP